MKRTITFAVVTAFFAFACEQQSNNTAQQNREEQNNQTQQQQPVKNVLSMSPEEFAKKAYEANLKEVQMAEIAAKKSTDKDIKAFAQTAMKDHKDANDKLLSLAQLKNVEVPKVLPEGEMDDIKELNEKKGLEFSKEYIDEVVDMHEESVDLFTRASENLEDQDLKQYASEMLPHLQHHLESAKNIQKKLEEKPASVKK